MTEIEKLNERIARLTDLVKSGEETISATKEMLKLAEQERDRLAVQRKETEQKFERVKEGEKYYIIDFDGYRSFVVKWDTEEDHPLDKASYDNNNYYHTEKRAKEVTNKLNFLLKLERLHDIYCPDFLPNWKNEHELKYSIFYDNCGKCYRISMFDVNDYKINTFFATKEIAQKVCDILNAELIGEKSNDY